MVCLLGSYITLSKCKCSMLYMPSKSIFYTLLPPTWCIKKLHKMDIYDVEHTEKLKASRVFGKVKYFACRNVEDKPIVMPKGILS